MFKNKKILAMMILAGLIPIKSHAKWYGEKGKKYRVTVANEVIRRHFPLSENHIFYNKANFRSVAVEYESGYGFEYSHGQNSFDAETHVVSFKKNFYPNKKDKKLSFSVAAGIAHGYSKYNHVKSKHDGLNYTVKVPLTNEEGYSFVPQFGVSYEIVDGVRLEGNIIGNAGIGVIRVEI